MVMFLISDLHFQHQFVANYRGFSSVEEHDEQLIKNINKRVSKSDDLFILGDVAMNANGIGAENNLKLLERINGHKYLITGNHDRCAPSQSNGFKHQSEYLKYFESVSQMAVLHEDGKTFWLNHYPYDTTDPLFVDGATNMGEFDEFKLPDLGGILIHGHTHTKALITHSQKGSIQVNVNVESTDMKPLRLSEIAKMIPQQ